MSNTSLLDFESLVSISSNEDSFYVLASTIQSLYVCLRERYSARTINEYLKLMAHLLENDLDLSKRRFLHQHLVKMITHQTQDEYAASYFKHRFSHVELLELLKYHHNLTGNLLTITNINYSEQKFKIKQVKLASKSHNTASTK